MTTKPDDIPHWAWDESYNLFSDLESLCLDYRDTGKAYRDAKKSDMALIARAILKAKNEALEKAATIADELFLDHRENHGDLYADDISEAIRNLKHETEV